uniref:BZIP domain-containing protein n=1 Tax=Panagrolaimus superbus TaxID=310955 RepID=A0A914XYF2_9BILA
MLVVDPIVEQPINDPMLIDNLQDTENDLEMTSMRHHDFMDQSEFERNVEGWEENPEFNLFDYIGDEEQDQGSSLADDPKDQLYKNWAYNQTTFGGNADYNLFQATYNNSMGRAPPSSSNQLNATVPNTYEPNSSYYDTYGSSSSASIGSTPPKMNNAGSFLPVKREPAYYEEESYLDDEYSRPSAAASAASSLIDPALVEQRVNQVTKKPPRKYRMKPDTEKVNPVYKMKRTKNNDAVRRSREKAKVIQQQKEQRLVTLENDIRTLYDYHLKTLEYMKQNCRCGIAIPKPPKLPSMDR